MAVFFHTGGRESWQDVCGQWVTERENSSETHALQPVCVPGLPHAKRGPTSAMTDTRELALKLAALEQELKARLDVHEVAIVDFLQCVMKILDPPPPPPEPPPPEIGFHVKEDAVPYRSRAASGLPNQTLPKLAVRRRTVPAGFNEST
jgi:hypothetical protein